MSGGSSFPLSLWAVASSYSGDSPVEYPNLFSQTLIFVSGLSEVNFPTARGWREPFGMSIFRAIEVMNKYRSVYGMVV